MFDNIFIYNCFLKSVNKMFLFELFMLLLLNGYFFILVVYFFFGFGLMKFYDNN